MMDAISELAKLFKDRENPNYSGIKIGEVKNCFPDLKIMLGEKIILNNRHLLISETSYNKNLKIGDKVILIPTENNQKFFLIDKVVG